MLPGLCFSFLVSMLILFPPLSPYAINLAGKFKEILLTDLECRVGKPVEYRHRIVTGTWT
jgi:hypothetical protein